MKIFRSRNFVTAVAWLVCAAAVSSGQRSASGRTGTGGEPRADRHVIMISVDGLVPEYYTAPARAGLRVPNLVRMKLDGAHAEGVEGIYPSVTYPAHTTLVTGARPAHHGIVQNRIFEAPTERQTREWYFFARDLKTETLWSAAKKAGLVTAAVGWPVTAEADIDYNFPEIFDPLEQPLTGKRAIQYATPGLLAKAFAAGLGNDTSTDGRRTAVSEYIIKTHKPNLMLIHLVEMDGAHHRQGVGSPAALEIAERIDGYIGRIVDATRAAEIFDKTTFFIVSDHGFAAVEKKFEPNVVLVKEKLITLDSEGKPVRWKAAAWPSGGSCAIRLRDPADKETAAKVADIFRSIAARRHAPLSRVLTPDELKRLGAIPEAALMLDAAPGYMFGEELTGPDIHESKDYRGQHGHLPSRVEMRSSLIVYGEGARAGARMTLARMIDIAPTAATLLGISLPEAEGRAIREFLKRR
ncbi:MAG: alkaline phosphatase family protein [Blastocatellia bacterium]|nr:alkaline phosphatase family protein [Blastocatellia bacterium]